MTTVRSRRVLPPGSRRGALGVMVPGGNHRMRPLERQPGGVSASGGMVQVVGIPPDDLDLLDPAAPPLEQPPVEEAVYYDEPAYRRPRRRGVLRQWGTGIGDGLLRLVEFAARTILMAVAVLVLLVVLALLAWNHLVEPGVAKLQKIVEQQEQTTTTTTGG